MRDKSHAVRVMSLVEAEIDRARGWGADILRFYHRGPGDTIERAAYEAQTKHSVPASFLMRLWNRPDIRDVKLSNWLSVRDAHEAICQKLERAADHQKHLADKARDAATDAGYRAADPSRRKASLLDSPKEI